jgi:SAM-dependent methyltransferase
MFTLILALLFVIDIIRLWRRAVTYPQLAKSSHINIQAPVLLDEYQLITAPGVEVPQDVLWRTAQWADDEGVLVIDLVPQSLPTQRILALLHQAHPIDYAQHPFVKGVTAGFAVLVHTSVLERCTQPDYKEEQSHYQRYIAWINFARSLKRYAPWASALVFAKGWEYREILPQDASERRAVLKHLYGPSFDHAKWAVPFVILSLIYCFYSSFFTGLGLYLLWAIQPILILTPQSFESSWLKYVILRPIMDLKAWVDQLGAHAPHDHEVIDPSHLKEHYQTQIESGLDQFFETRVEHCTLCQSSSLIQHIQVADQYQGKPGTFTLEKCESCEHIFQNPRLSLAGLNFYYEDFYDGLGEDGMDMIFGASEISYRQRVSMIRAYGSPQRWLDVGGGHGHFALIARHLLPQTSFDVLDLSESVEIAQQRRWCDQGIRGLFPECAPNLVDQYDGISMSHYLEHTLDPVAEVQAAAQVLGEGGLLMIEVPDPECRLGHYLKGFWLPWFQPQHLNLVPAKNLEKILNSHNFEVLALDRSQAHQSVDFFFAALILAQRLAPDHTRPWSTERGKIYPLWRFLVILACLPLFILGTVIDRTLRPLFTRPTWSNTYRILARKLSTTEVVT